MGIAGAAFLDKAICEPLTPIVPLFYINHNENILYQTAHMLKSLKVALGKLRNIYDNQSFEYDDVNFLSQLSFPYINSVTIAGKSTQLTYIEQIRKHLIFEAYVNEESERSYKVAIKFTKNYSEICHSSCYEMGIAPKLLAFEKIPGEWHVVVMEWLENYTTLFDLAQNGGIGSEVSSAVIESVKLLHRNGFVHGDLRGPNIMIGNNNQVKFIDFEWAGKEGEATYPMLLNTEIGWHNDVIPGGKIKIIHDEHMVKKELSGLMKSKLYEGHKKQRLI